jgi:hypothetical protein
VVVERLGHVDPLDGRAHLAVVVEGAGEDGLGHHGRIGVVQHDGGVVAAQLQGDPLEVRGGRHGHLLARLDGAGEADLAGTGWLVIHAPRSSPPLTTLTTPGGITSAGSSTTLSVESGVKGEGLSTRVLPASRAGAIFQKGQGQREVPRGDGGHHADRPAHHLHPGLVVVLDDLGRHVSRLAKYWHQMAAAKTSTLASASGLPCSAVSTGADLAVEASSTSAIRSRVARPPRRLPVPLGLGGGVEGGVELLAAALGASAKTSPVAGLRPPLLTEPLSHLRRPPGRPVSAPGGAMVMTNARVGHGGDRADCRGPSRSPRR